MKLSNIIINFLIDFNIVDVKGVKKIDKFEFNWPRDKELGINTLAKDNDNNYYKILFGQSNPDTIKHITELSDNTKTEVKNFGNNEFSECRAMFRPTKLSPSVTKVTQKSIFESLHFEEYFLANFNILTTELETKREQIKKNKNDLINEDNKLNQKEKELQKKEEANKIEKDSVDTENNKLKKELECLQRKVEANKNEKKTIEKENNSLKIRNNELNKKVETIGTNEKKDIKENNSDLSRKYFHIFYISVILISIMIIGIMIVTFVKYYQKVKSRERILMRRLGERNRENDIKGKGIIK